MKVSDRMTNKVLLKNVRHKIFSTNIDSYANIIVDATLCCSEDINEIIFDHTSRLYKNSCFTAASITWNTEGDYKVQRKIIYMKS